MSELPPLFALPRPPNWPANLPWPPVMPAVFGPRELTAFELRGRKLWSNFHMAMQVFDSRSASQVDVLRWLADFIGQVPTGGCACRQNFEALLVETPLPAGERFAWSVGIHNAINRKLGKRDDWSIEEARERWARRTAPKARMRN